MGALHEGHLSLVRASMTECDFTVVTIFVNPTQFGPAEDFDKYPRTLETDLAAVRECGADVVFAPANKEVYPKDCSTLVEPPQVASRLEGECRPGHFRGVATIVLKLFNMSLAEIAYFGQKDYQQALVICHMVRDLDVPVQVRICPIVREPDGLAMSSRNRYLTDGQRRQALALSRSLELARRAVDAGQQDAAGVTASMRRILSDAGITRIDYVALVDPDTLEPVETLAAPLVALVAAYAGDTRLIDNCRIERNAGV
jgi:pantoate--beta-alanine ligase